MLADILGYVNKSPTTINKLTVDIVRTMEFSYQQDVTSHPVEDGFEIHDSIQNKPLRLSMAVGIASMPVTWYWRNGQGSSKFASALAALEAIRDAKEIVTVARPDKIYENMVLTGCRVSKNGDSKSILQIDVEFTQIRKVETQTTEIPENIVDASAKEKAGETAADGGSASVSDIGSVGSSGSTVGADGTAQTSSASSSSGGTFSDITSGDKSILASGVDSVKSAIGLG